MPTGRSILDHRRTLSVLALAAAGVMSAAGAAVAADRTDNLVPIPHAVEYAGCGTWGLNICLTDNSKVYYYMDSKGDFELESDDRAWVRTVLRDQYSPTHLVIHYDENPTFDGGGETDIVYQEGSKGIDDDSVGMAWCNAEGNDRYDCDQQYVRIRATSYNNVDVICHETGHAVGLVHGQDASPAVNNEAEFLKCMKTPSDFGDPLGTNNRRNINNHYAKP